MNNKNYQNSANNDFFDKDHLYDCVQEALNDFFTDLEEVVKELQKESGSDKVKALLITENVKREIYSFSCILRDIERREREKNGKLENQQKEENQESHYPYPFEIKEEWNPFETEEDLIEYFSSTLGTLEKLEEEYEEWEDLDE